MDKKTKYNRLRNFVWIIAGIILMGVGVLAVTTISDTAITTTGDLNIGGNISFDNAPLHFQSNGNSLLFINHSDGNVGIGISSPEQRLVIVGDSNVTERLFVGGNLTVDTDSLFVDSNNNRVGIRTNTPQYMLDMGVNTYVGFDGLFGHIIQHNSASSQFWTLATRNNGNFDIATTTSDPRPGGNVISSSNAKLTIIPNGSIGIGTTSPDQKLHSQISSTTTGVYAAHFENTGNGGTADGILIELGVTGNPTGNNEFIEFADGDTVDIGAIEGDGVGGITLFSSSDRRLKENIRNTSHSLLDLMEIKVRDFNFIGTNKPSTGFIAQELNEVYPLAVSVGDFEEKVQDSWKVSLEKLVPLTIKAIQEQQSQIEELKSENDLLKDRLTQIEERLNSVELMCKW